MFPKAGRLVRIDAFAADSWVQQSAGEQGEIADDFGFEADSGKTGQFSVFRVEPQVFGKNG